MKRLILALLLGLLALPAMAVDLTLQWDPMPAGQAWENVVAYEKVGTTYVNKGQVVGTATTLTITNVAIGSHTYIVRSKQAAIESADSNSASKDIAPVNPGNLRILVVTLDETGKVEFRFFTPEEYANFFRG